MTNRGGYTILETMITLAVSASFFTMIMFTFSGRQGRVEFAQGMRDIEAHILDVSNDVRNGYYPNANQVCSIDSGALKFSIGTTSQGTNSACVFMGKVMHFNSSTVNPSKITTYSIAGDRTVTDNSNLKQNLIGNNGDETAEEYRMPAGITTIDSDGAINSYLIGMLFDVGVSGASTASITPYVFDLSGNDLIAIKKSVNANLDKATQINSDSGKALCFKSGTSNQSASITIRKSSNGISTVLAIGQSGSVC